MKMLARVKKHIILKHTFSICITGDSAYLTDSDMYLLLQNHTTDITSNSYKPVTSHFINVHHI